MTKTEDVIRQAVIDTDGLDEEIRCEMCKNPMHTERGCDGNCKYDQKLYERILRVLDRRQKMVSASRQKEDPMNKIVEKEDVLNLIEAVWSKYGIDTIDQFRDELREQVLAMPAESAGQKWLPKQYEVPAK